MVYKGPSRGCHECRKRRVKCDERRPHCGNCIKRKHDCPGYRDSFDTIHKDETLNRSLKATSRRPRKAPTAVEAHEDGSHELMVQETSEASTGDAYPWSSDYVNELSLLIQPSRRVAMESMSYFITYYVNTPRDPSTNRFIEHILPMYLNCKADSALAEAVHASAINIASLWMKRHVDTYPAREAYCTSVSRLKTLLADPVQCKTDETLTTVFMLDFYDSLNRRIDQIADTGTHQQGAIALIKHRGDDNFKTPISQRLFNAWRSRHVNHALQNSRRVTLDPAFLAEETAVLPSAKLDLLHVELADLYLLGQGGPEATDLSMIEYHQLVKSRSLALEKKFQAWRDSLPKSWQPVAVPASELHPSIREAGVYQDMCDVYSSLAVSQINNAARLSHVGVLRLIALSMKSLAQLGIPPDPEVRSMIDERAQAIVDRFCASIPFHLGNRTGVSFPHEVREYPHIPVELQRLANYVDPFGNEVPMTMEDHSRAAAAAGGWFILTPLAGFLRSPIMSKQNAQTGPLMRILRKGQLEWVRGQMSRIQNIHLLPFGSLSSMP